MNKIKTKDSINKTIKQIDKPLILSNKVKNNIKINDNESTYEYADNKVIDDIEVISNKSIKEFDKQGRKDFIKAKNNILNVKDKMNCRKMSKKDVKTNNNQVRKNVNNTKKVTQKSKELVEKSYKTTKKVVNTSIKAIKAMIAGTKALVSAIIAGGWISVIVITLICFIGLLCSSIYGVFFSNETGSKTMTTVIRETNKEVYNKIETIKKNNLYDEVEIESTYSNWEEVISVYSVKYSENGTYNITVIDEDNESKLKGVFWDFNKITSKVEFVSTKEDEKIINKRKLIIKIESKSKEDIMKQYKFTEEQKNQVNELLDEQYDDLWLNLIYGSLEGNKQIVEIAKQQIGNVGGEPYWRWYGYNSRVEWCCVFVSWVANQAGVLNTSIPKFAGVYTGIEWFKARGEWQEKGYKPRPGDIIFFDWEQDGKPNHVGIVEKVEGNTIYTIEGNSTDDGCRNKKYNINSKYIYGYGIPEY